MIAPPVESGLMAAAKGCCGDGCDQFYIIDTSKALADFCGNRVQGWHDNCGCGTHPRQDSGSCCHNRGCGMLCHERSQRIRNQVNAAQQADHVDQNTDAADHEQGSPWDALNCFPLIRAAKQDQHRCPSRKQKSGIQLKTDAADNHDHNCCHSDALFSIELRNFRKLHRIICFYFVSFIQNIYNQRKHKSG